MSPSDEVSLHQKLDAQARTLSLIVANQNAQAARLGANTAYISALSSELAILQIQIGVLMTEIEVINEALNTLRREVGETKDLVTASNQVIKDQTAKIAELSQQIEDAPAIKAALLAAADTINAESAKLDALQNPAPETEPETPSVPTLEIPVGESATQ